MLILSRDTKLKSLDDRLNAAKSIVDTKESAFITETDGTSGTMTQGYGKQAEIKEKAFNAELTTYLQFKTRIDKERRDIIQDTDKEIALITTTQSHGILASLRALHNIDDDYVQYAIMGLRALLLFIELLPFFIKLTINPDDEYTKICLIEKHAYQKAAETTVSSEIEIHEKRRAAELVLKAIVEENQKHKAMAHSYDSFLTGLNHSYNDYLRRHYQALKKIEKMPIDDYKKQKAIDMLNNSLHVYSEKLNEMMDYSQDELHKNRYQDLFKDAA